MLSWVGRGQQTAKALWRSGLHSFPLPPGKAQSLELTLFLPLHGLLGSARVLRGNPRAASLSLPSLNQGQLELLRRLFTEALYEEALSQVSAGRREQWPPSHSSSPGATRAASPPGTAKREQTWSCGVGMGLTCSKPPQQRVVSGRRAGGCPLSALLLSPHSGSLRMDSGLSLLLLGPTAKELGPG